MSFQPGYSMQGKWTPNGGAQVTVQVTGISVDESVQALEVTHSATGGIGAWIAGVYNADVTVDFNLDIGIVNAVNPNAGNNPWGSTNLKAGTKGVFTFQPQSVGTGGFTNPWSLPILIEKVSVKSQVGSVVSITVSGKVDQITGTATYPS